MSNLGIYKSEEFPPKFQEFQPILDQLSGEFRLPFEIRWQVENFGSWFTAAVVNTQTNFAAIIPLSRDRTQTELLRPLDIQKIREHFASGAERDFTLQISPIAK